MWLPFIPLGGNKFSDTGYRLRKNTFIHNDNWLPFTNSGSASFYDTKIFNSDTFDVTKEYNTIAELYFRIDTDSFEHTRIVF